MLASAADVLPHGAEWAYEFKWDGVRALADLAEERTRLRSRNGNDISTAYPELTAPLDGDVLLDGEIVAFIAGRPSFEALQTRMHVRDAREARRLATATPVTFMAFDVLRVDGAVLGSQPYRERRASLEAWIAAHDGPFSLSPRFDDGAATEQVARDFGLEGVVAKRLGAPYRSGMRSPDWVKMRFVRAGDFAVVGWEAAAQTPDTLSSLVLATASPAGLVFAGKAGSGLDARTASALQRRLHPVKRCPLGAAPATATGRATRWVRPEVVVEVGFAAWTAEGRLRHPVFRRVRSDKTVDEAVGDA